MKPIANQVANSGRTALTLMVDCESDLESVPDSLGITQRPVIVLVGGATRLDDHPLIARFFDQVLAPLAESLQAIVVDGGTDCGVMQLMGAARCRIQGSFPLVGVAAQGTVALGEHAGGNDDEVVLESRHSHFVLVPGNRWGDESPWIARTATMLSQSANSVTVVVNGGDITLRDIACSIAERRPVLVLAGSGRSADRVAAAIRGEVGDREIAELVSSNLVHSLELHLVSAELLQVLRSWIEK